VFVINMAQATNNHVNENSLTKLLLNSTKCNNLIDVAFNRRIYDPSYPISIELHLTNRCNLNCEWCVDKPIRSNRKDIPLEALIRLLDFLAEKNIGITIEGGGEPTIYDHFDEFVWACHERKISIGLITNGVRPLSSAVTRCFNWIRVSLDAATPEEYLREKGKDYYHTIIENIRNIRKMNREVVLGLSYVLTRRNYQNLSLLFHRLNGMDINYIRFRSVEEYEDLNLTGSMMREIGEVIQAHQNKVDFQMTLSTDIQTYQSNNNSLPCIAHSLRSIIHANGEVVLCEKRRHDPVILGNIVNESFPDIWNSDKRIAASRKLLDQACQEGCMVCRITKFNELFFNLTKVKTSKFI
jgi:radical SAM protein with 4Fe4S-binding SPASM domain